MYDIVIVVGICEVVVKKDDSGFFVWSVIFLVVFFDGGEVFIRLWCIDVCRG